MKEIVKYLVKVVQVAGEAWCRKEVRTQKVSQMKAERINLSLVSHMRKRFLLLNSWVVESGALTSFVWFVCVRVCVFFKAIL